MFLVGLHRINCLFWFPFPKEKKHNHHNSSKLHHMCVCMYPQRAAQASATTHIIVLDQHILFIFFIRFLKNINSIQKGNWNDDGRGCTQFFCAYSLTSDPIIFSGRIIATQCGCGGTEEEEKWKSLRFEKQKRNENRTERIYKLEELVLFLRA